MAFRPGLIPGGPTPEGVGDVMPNGGPSGPPPPVPRPPFRGKSGGKKGGKKSGFPPKPNGMR